MVVLEGHVRLTAFMLARGQLPPEPGVLVGVLAVDDPLGLLVAGPRGRGRP
jgi:hypothetical protein